ncbi:TetR/AcrR family transcriptional regulator [Virgibacillus sp. AGTR]|uniref:TetR/AcrR family transcriptional regulator n=1 Tax=unclassified Virgibacillus TaxID=2620237 RepID=UPI0019637B2F|nr:MULTISPECIES: TetR/AcrR family transcriptional regulator [unclassified Virgibacillus]MCC2248642.1 TetR/AcrR family transcriptional regulator [Virgibacillus sp. AGTR]MDY7045871.1 TetR/AcrR family transcriptional regulator [Virgibacillus sp. M23]QRZ18397.1 TetR/AcrR family transcriptional regulator [Virgibacillus sp. AGTR]
MLREARKKELKEKIFFESIRLFSEKGIDEVSVSEITKACGIAKGTFYNYFSTKESVLLFVGQSQMDRITNIQESLDMDVKQKIITLFTDLTTRYEEYPKLMKFAVAELFKTSGIIDDEMNAVQQLKDLLMNLLKEEIEREHIKVHGELEDIASILLGTYFTSVMMWVHHEQSVTTLLQSVNRRVSLLLEQFIMNKEEDQ